MSAAGESPFSGLQWTAWTVAAVGAAICVFGAASNATQFYRSYLLAFTFWIGLPLGGLAVVMIHHLAGGQWGFAVRRIAEAGAATVPLMLALFAPIVAGLSELFIWAREDAVALDPLLRHQRAWLNPPFFLARAGACFAAWIVLGALLRRWSRRQDERDRTLAMTRRLRALSGPGLVVLGLTATSAAIDWGMSLQPHWTSAVYGAGWLAGHGVAGLAFAIAAAAWLGAREPLSTILAPSRLHDLGNLLLGFVLLWAYLAFSQLLIIWSGNLPEEASWYVVRGGGGWVPVTIALVVLHFAAPFLVLLFRDVKRSRRVLGATAAGLLLARLLDCYWHVVPAFAPSGPSAHWLDPAALTAIGGLWLAAFLELLRKAPLVPEADPRLRREAPHE